MLKTVSERQTNEHRNVKLSEHGDVCVYVDVSVQWPAVYPINSI